MIISVILRVAECLNDRYQVESVLGQGSFGRVVKAFDHRENCSVAVKIAKSSSDFSKAAQTEVKILKLLQKTAAKRHIGQLFCHVFFYGPCNLQST